jgi:hypothetical protein
MAMFMYPHLTHKVFSLTNVDLLNMPFLRNKTMLDEDLLKLNSVAFSPQVNYTDRATVACQQS